MKIKYLIPRIFLGICGLIFFCEYLIYYVVLAQCSWPELNPGNEDDTPVVPGSKPVKVMLLADTHLLGSRRGHWADKLRREWQMHRTFQTAMSLHAPDLVFVLGDLFDEGLWCSDDEFLGYIERFHSLFKVPAGTHIYVVVGNHDIGFHYGITPYLQERFTKGLNAPSVKLLTIGGNHFVLLNSMAMEGDGCFLCRPAELQINRIAKSLRCAKYGTDCTEANIEQYSRPILLQHFPLYRNSDEECHEPDEAPEDEKKIKFRERWECLSRESSNMLLESLNPRVVLTGHTHHGCHRHYKARNTHEYTIPSFSWRNKDNPSFVLAVFVPNNYAISKCYMPCESTVFLVYLIGFLVLFVSSIIMVKERSFFKKQNYFKMH